MGPQAGFIDIEADNEAEEQAFLDLFDGCDIPATPTFKSRHGVHRLFAWNEVLAVTNKAVVKFKGLGIRIGANGKGAHSCIPPSVNDDGTAREWIISLDDCEPADLPPVVLRRILEANKPEPPAPAAPRITTASIADKADQARRYMTKVEGAVEGQHGHDATFRAACVLILDFDLSPDEAWPLFCEWNEKCQPPWGERDLRRKLEEADKQTSERGGKLRERRRNGHDGQNDRRGGVENQQHDETLISDGADYQHHDVEAALLEAAAEDCGPEVLAIDDGRHNAADVVEHQNDVERGNHDQQPATKRKPRKQKPRKETPVDAEAICNFEMVEIVDKDDTDGDEDGEKKKRKFAFRCRWQRSLPELPNCCWAGRAASATCCSSMTRSTVSRTLTAERRQAFSAGFVGMRKCNGRGGTTS